MSDPWHEYLDCRERILADIDALEKAQGIPEPERSYLLGAFQRQLDLLEIGRCAGLTLGRAGG